MGILTIIIRILTICGQSNFKADRLLAMKKLTLAVAICAYIISYQPVQANVLGAIVGGTVAVVLGIPIGAVVGLPTGIVKGAVDSVTNTLIPTPNLPIKILWAPIGIPIGIVSGALIGIVKGAASGARMGYNIVNEGDSSNDES